MDNFEKLYNKTLYYLSFRPRSEKEVRDYLKKNKADEKNTALIIEKLKDYKFLDDIEFAKRWVEQRTKLKPRAQRVVKLELKRKGITNEIIEQVFTIDDLQITNDKESALILAEKRLSRLKTEPRQKQYEKMFRYLSSKGFDYDIIKEVIDRILPKEYNS